MISYDVICFICKKTFAVNEKSPQYQMVKHNYHGKHACQDCRETIERDAMITTGINRELLEQLDAIDIDLKTSPLF